MGMSWESSKELLPSNPKQESNQKTQIAAIIDLVATQPPQPLGDDH
jgi:hypothetical protein